MKLKNIKTVKDLENYIEGILNDFEAGVSDKEETSSLIADLIIHVQKAVKEEKSLRDIIDYYHCPKCDSDDIVLSGTVFICLDCRHEWDGDTSDIKEM